MQIKHRPLLTEERISKLKRGKMYGLYREPGSGKTYFFKNIMLPYCLKNNKSALFLVHRLTFKKQTETDLEEVLNWEREFKKLDFTLLLIKVLNMPTSMTYIIKLNHYWTWTSLYVMKLIIL